MAETVAATDIGFLTQFGKLAGAVFTPLAELNDIGTPETARDSVDFTHFGSPDFHREFKPGLNDAGELPIGYNLVPGLADDAVIATHLGSRMVETWQILYPNGAKFVFKGFATKHSRATPMDDKMVGAATFKISGKPVLTPAA